MCPRRITLEIDDGTLYTVDEDIGMKIGLIQEEIHSLEPGTSILLPNVTSTVFDMVLLYLYIHLDDIPPLSDAFPSAKLATVDKNKEFSEWDKEYARKLKQSSLFDLILAANVLDIPSLLNLGCYTTANLIRGKSPEEIRKTFNIVNDFTPEEEEQIRLENLWCEDRPDENYYLGGEEEEEEEERNRIN